MHPVALTSDCVYAREYCAGSALVTRPQSVFLKHPSVLVSLVV